MLDKQASTAAGPTASTTTSSVSIKQEKEEAGSVAVKVEKLEKLDELDSVFSPAVEDVATSSHQASSVVPTPDATKKTHPGDEVHGAATPAGSHRNHTRRSVTTDQSGDVVPVTTESTDQRQPQKKQDISLFSWCEHHQKLVELLSCVVQTIALSCTTALVHLPLADPSNRLLVAREEKDYSLLRNLQFSICNLPIPSGLSSDSRKKQQVYNMICAHRHTRAHIHTHTHTYKHTHIHTHTYKHIHTNTLTHTLFLCFFF